MKHILVLDVGTSSTRGILLKASGKELCRHQIRYSPEYLADGRVEQEPEIFTDTLDEILRQTAATSRKNGWSIDAISLTAQRSSVIPVDRSLTPLSKAIMWHDRRTEGICQRLSSADELIIQKSGSRINPVYAGSKMAWLREEAPDLYEKAYKLIVISDYLLAHLTGNLMTDTTYGSRTNLMNLASGEWDEELTALFGLDPKKLSPLVSPGTLCGYVREQVAVSTGIPAGIPVITAGGDQQCSAVGQGALSEGDICLNAGTGGFLIGTSNRIPDSLSGDITCNRASLPGHFVLEYNLLTCGGAFDWFRNEFYPEDPSYEHIAAELDKTSFSAEGCLCLPYFQGRGTPDYNLQAKAQFLDVTLHTRRCDLLRALLEGIAFELAEGLEVLRRYMPVARIYIGGGLTSAPFFCDLLSQALHETLICPDRSDTTALGALIIAASSLGLYSDARHAAETILSRRRTVSYNPREEDARILFLKRQRAAELYRRLYCK